MKSIIITGDVHGEITRFNEDVFEREYYLRLKESKKEENFMIVCGDFGFVWVREPDKTEKYYFDILKNKPFTILFVDGNHENHFRLNNDFPVVDFYGGKVHKLEENIYHLMRGEVYEIFGKKFFTFGGAGSHDIIDGILDVDDPSWKDKSKAMMKAGKYLFRVKGLSWWPEEMPTEAEMEYGLSNLKKHNNTVDYIITHQPCKNIMTRLSLSSLDFNDFTDYLQKIDDTVDFEKWYAGHMHTDQLIDINHRQIYYDIECVYRED